MALAFPGHRNVAQLLILIPSILHISQCNAASISDLDGSSTAIFIAANIGSLIIGVAAVFVVFWLVRHVQTARRKPKRFKQQSFPDITEYDGISNSVFEAVNSKTSGHALSVVAE